MKDYRKENFIVNDLVMKNMDLLGDTVVAAQDRDGHVWAGVRWLCEGLGLTKGQMQGERVKIQEDVVLKEGERNFVLPTNGGKFERKYFKLLLD